MERHELEILNHLVDFAVEQKQSAVSFEEAEVVKVVHTWLQDGAAIRQVCPHCGSVAAYGDGRYRWLRVHIQSSSHAFYWRLRRTLRCA